MLDRNTGKSYAASRRINRNMGVHEMMTDESIMDLRRGVDASESNISRSGKHMAASRQEQIVPFHGSNVGYLDWDNKLSITNHAHQRMGQRAFRPRDLHLILNFATEIPKDRLKVTRKDTSNGIEMCKLLIRRLEPLSIRGRANWQGLRQLHPERIKDRKPLFAQARFRLIWQDVMTEIMLGKQATRDSRRHDIYERMGGLAIRQDPLELIRAPYPVVNSERTLLTSQDFARGIARCKRLIGEFERIEGRILVVRDGSLVTCFSDDGRKLKSQTRQRRWQTQP